MKNTLQTLQKKRKSKKGFTLMEMLIVVAIIAILVAIAIPVFGAQLNNAKAQVEVANKRSAQSMAVTQYLLDKDESSPTTGTTTYDAILDDKHNMTIETPATGDKYYEVVIDNSTGKVTSVSDIKTK